MGTRNLSIRAFALVVAVVLMAGCATPRGTLQVETSPEEHFWPNPPEVPRYRYVGQLTGEADFHTEQSMGKRATGFFEWLAGLVSGKAEPIVLQRPQSGMVDGDGRIYVTDVSRQAVYVFDNVAGRLRQWEWATPQTRFIAPIGIAPGKNGQVLVADSELGLVARLGPDGTPLEPFGGDVLVRPTGLARDAAHGRIYVSDTRKHDIKVFDDTGRLLKTIGHRGTAPGEFNFPTYLAFFDDRLYVTDSMNARIQVLRADGAYDHTFGQRGLFVGDIPHPKGVAVDDEGDIYVIESYYDYLLVYNEKGELLLPIGGTGRGVGEFYLPAGVWTDSRNHIYVADMFNGRIVIFQYLGGS